MDRSVAALAAVLFASVAEAQGTPHSHPRPEKPGAQQVPVPQASDKADGYRSPFSDYRPFSQELTPKEWRRANDEVREAGGHAGLMKGELPPLKEHGSRGAKQPTPPPVHHK